MDELQYIGLIGAIASIVGFMLQAKELKERIIHGVYSFIVALLAGGFIYYKNSLDESTKIENQASILIQTSKDIITNGEERGFILGTLAFLEKNKDYYPDTYERAKQLASNIQLLESKEDDRAEAIHQGWKLHDVSEAMKQLLKGISGGKT